MAESARASWWELYELWPLDRVEAFDRAVDAFETAWRNGKDPAPDSYREQASPEEWPRWLAELLSIEMLARRKRGEAIDQDHFLGRYPQHTEAVRLAWNETLAAAPGDPTRTLIPSQAPPKEHLLSDGQLLDGGRYVIERFVKGGGMGELYRGRRVSDGRVFAFKALDIRRKGAMRDDEPAAEDNRTSLGRFLREMDVLADLRHPHLVSSIELLRLPTLPPIIVMDWVDGKDLNALVRERGPLSISDACEIARQAADGLDHAWQKYELVHRDIKPANIMLSFRGEVKVLDFGLARARSATLPDGEEHLTRSNAVLGTTAFMAPEQSEDPRTVTSAADVYSLGITLFFLLTGKHPFTIDKPIRDDLALRQAHAVLAPPDLRKWRPEVDIRLARLIDRMLAKDPDNRPALGKLSGELRAWTTGAELSRRAADDDPRADNSVAQNAFWTRRRLFLAGCGVCGGGTAALATLFGPRFLPGPQVLDFTVTLYQAATKNAAEKTLGLIGHNIDDVPTGGLVQVDVRLSAACYVQLFAANSDGSVRLLVTSEADPSAVEPSAGRLDAVSFPRQGRWQLCDAEGLQAFVLIASRNPLPPFAAWREKARLERLWPGPIDKVGVWQTRGDTIQALHPDDTRPRDGGHVESNVPPALERFWKGILAALPSPVKAELVAFSLS